MGSVKSEIASEELIGVDFGVGGDHEVCEDAGSGAAGAVVFPGESRLSR